MDDPDGDPPGDAEETFDRETFDRVFSDDRKRVATWSLSSAVSDADSQTTTYEVTLWDARTGRRIAGVTRRWSVDRHTGRRSGSPLSDVRFGSSGSMLLLGFEDGSKEAVPLPPDDATPADPPPLPAPPPPPPFLADDEAAEFQTGAATLYVEAEPCSICGAAAWTSDVCESCARYCEELLATGGIRPTFAQLLEEERERARAPSPACALCGARGRLAVSGPVGHACQTCVTKLRSP